MNIAFDFDGILRRSHLGMLKICEDINSYEGFKIQSMINDQILNPMLFALKNDKIFIISNCSNDSSIKEKKNWLKHFFGNRVKFIPIIGFFDKWKKAYVDKVAKQKVDIMLKLGIDIYFDDDPAIIRVMRSMTDKIKFVKYGSWIEEYY